MVALLALATGTLLVTGVVWARRQQRLARRQQQLQAELVRLREQHQQHGVGPVAVVAAAAVGALVLGAAVVVAGALVSVALLVGAVVVGGSVVGGLMLVNGLGRRQEQAVEAQFARWLTPPAPPAYSRPELSGYCPGCADAAVAVMRARREHEEVAG